MVAGPSVLARVVPFERTFLPAVAFEDRRIQVQAVAFGSRGYALHLPLHQRREQTLDITHAELPEQIADCVVGGESLQAQQRLQGTVSTQPVGVREALGAQQHGDQKRGEGRGGVDVIR